MRHRFSQVHKHDSHTGICFVGCLTRQHLKQHDPKRVNVSAPIQFIGGACLLRTHVGGRANDVAAGQSSPRLLQMGNAKISQKRIVEPVKQDVRRFKIAVNNALLVGIIQCWPNPCKQFDRFSDGKRTIFEPVS